MKIIDDHLFDRTISAVYTPKGSTAEAWFKSHYPKIPVYSTSTVVLLNANGGTLVGDSAYQATYG